MDKMEKSTELRKLQDLRLLYEQVINLCEELSLSYRDIQDHKDKVKDMENSLLDEENNKKLKERG